MNRRKLADSVLWMLINKLQSNQELTIQLLIGLYCCFLNPYVR